MTASGFTPFEVGARDRVVGVFVILAVLLFLVGFLIPLVQRLNQEDGIPFYTLLDQTYGIGIDAAVSLRGVPIGNVTDVGMTEDGRVRVNIKLSPKFADFYTEGSSLEVDTEIGVATILTGSGLLLHPASDQAPLEPDSFIPTATPQGISSLLDEIDVVYLTDQVTEIVANVEEITRGFNDNQDKIFRSLDNLEQVTASLAEVSQALPQMVGSVDRSIGSLEQSLAGVDRLIANTDEDLQATLANTVALTQQASLTLAEAEVLFRESRPVLRQLPATLVSIDIALQSMTTLSDQMSRSWLLGGSEASPTPERTPGPPLHPHDDSLYP